LKLHVLTAVSRPENLPQLAESLAGAAARAPEAEIAWHWRFDVCRTQIGGQALKNEMLDEVTDGWVCFLDDDTLMHPDLLASVDDLLREAPETRAILVAQQRNEGRVLSNSLAVGSVDIGQAVLRRDAIGDIRIPEHYNGDGEFLQAIFESGVPFTYTSEVLSWHNRLTGVEVSV
jgi:hypothetical protein